MQRSTRRAISARPYRLQLLLLRRVARIQQPPAPHVAVRRAQPRRQTLRATSEKGHVTAYNNGGLTRYG
jgi:hypothetical protein